MKTTDANEREDDSASGNGETPGDAPTQTTTTTITELTTTTTASSQQQQQQNTNIPNPDDPPRDMEAIKAAARAYALSSQPKKTKRKKQQSTTPPVPANTTQKGKSTRGPPIYHGYYPPPHSYQGDSSSYPQPHHHLYPPPPHHHHHPSSYYPPPPPPHTASTTTIPPRPYPHYGRKTTNTQHSTTQQLPPLRITKRPEEWDEYDKFVHSLLQDDNLTTTETLPALLLDDEDDEEEFLMDEKEEEDDDDDEQDKEPGDNRNNNNNTSAMDAHDHDTETPAPSSSLPSVEAIHESSSVPSHLDDFDLNFYQELEQELGWLEEEDMEAAVATLVGQPLHARPSERNANERAAESSASMDESTSKNNNNNDNNDNYLDANDDAANSEKVETAPTKAKTTLSETEMEDDQASLDPTAPHAAPRHMEVTEEQYQTLQILLSKHFQLLQQHAVLATRTAHRFRWQGLGSTSRRSYLNESVDELVEILDGAVGMLKDLDQHRKDEIRHLIQFEDENNARDAATTSIRESSMTSKRDLFGSGGGGNNNSDSSEERHVDRRLTRAQFVKTLQHRGQRRQHHSIFEIPGLDRIYDTFQRIDESVQRSEQHDPSSDENPQSCILTIETDTQACKQVLDDCGAVYDASTRPGGQDLSMCFAAPTDILGDSFTPPCTKEQETWLRRNRNLFTAGEDNLVLRGVNTYGEKQTTLISDRFLPDRSMNIIGHRYSKLCLLLYKANGVEVDEKGNLATPPKLTSTDDLDEEKTKTLTKVPPPAILNVHRWSLEEDITILRAVPIYGTMWAEIAARLLDHRDRGHIRKRYAVLGRRVKAIVAKEKKQGQRDQSFPRNESTPGDAKQPMVFAERKSATDRTSTTAKHPMPPNGEAYAPYHGYAQHAPYAGTLPYHPPPYPYSYPPPPHQAHWPQRPPPPKGTASPSIKMDHASIATAASVLMEEGSRAAFENLVQETGDISRLTALGKRPLVHAAGASKKEAVTESGTKKTEQATGGSLFAGVLRKAGDSGVETRHGSGSGLDKLSSAAAMVPLTDEGNNRNRKRDSTTAESPGKRLKPSATAPGTPTQFSRVSSFEAPFKSPSFTLMTLPGGEESNMNGSINGNAFKGIFDGSPATAQSPSTASKAGKAQTADPSPSTAKAGASSQLFGEGRTLMEADLEDAISALNSLSSSPAVAPTANSNSGNSGTTSGAASSSNGKSLFARAVGSRKFAGAAKKKRLQF